MRRRGLVHLTALLSLRVINSDSPLTTLNEDNERNHDDSERKHAQQNQDIKLALPRLFERLPNRLRQARNDTCKNKERYAVTNTLLGDLLTQPHHEDSTSDQ